jgi:hypothetical protein
LYYGEGAADGANDKKNKIIKMDGALDWCGIGLSSIFALLLESFS